MATITLKSTINTLSNTISTTGAVNLPANIAAGDYLVCVVKSNNNTNYENVTISGFNRFMNTSIGLNAFYKVATGTEGSNVTVTFPIAKAFIAETLNFFGADPTFPPMVPTTSFPSTPFGGAAEPGPSTLRSGVGNTNTYVVSILTESPPGTLITWANTLPAIHDNIIQFGTGGLHIAGNLISGVNSFLSNTANMVQGGATTFQLYFSVAEANTSVPRAIILGRSILGLGTGPAVKSSNAFYSIGGTPWYESKANDLVIMHITASNNFVPIVNTGITTSVWTRLTANIAAPEHIFYRFFDGTESGPDKRVVAFTNFLANSTLAFQSSVIFNANISSPPTIAVSSGTSATPDPPNLTGLNAGTTYQLLTTFGTVTPGTATNVPTNFTSSLVLSTTGSSAWQTGVTGITSINPATFTIPVSAAWNATTIAVATAASSIPPPSNISGSSTLTFSSGSTTGGSGRVNGSTTITFTSIGSSLDFTSNFDGEGNTYSKFNFFPANLKNYIGFTSNVGEHWSGNTGFSGNGYNSAVTTPTVYMDNPSGNLNNLYVRFYYSLQNVVAPVNYFSQQLITCYDSGYSNLSFDLSMIMFSDASTQLQLSSNNYNTIFYTIPFSTVPYIWNRFEGYFNRSANTANLFVNGTNVGSFGNTQIGIFPWAHFSGLLQNENGTQAGNRSYFIDDIQITSIGLPGPINTVWNIQSSSSNTNFSSNTALGGTGNLSSSGTLTFTSNPNLTGLGSINSSSFLSFTSSSYLGSIVYITASTSFFFGSNTSIGGIGNANASGTLSFTSSDVLGGSGRINVSSTLAFTPIASLMGTASISASGILTFNPSGMISGKASINSSTVLTFSSGVILTGLAAINAATNLSFSSSDTLKGNGSINSSGTLTFSQNGTVLGKGLLTSGSTLTFNTQGSMLGAGSMNASTTLTFTVLAQTASLSYISSATTMSFSQDGFLAGIGNLNSSSNISFTTITSTLTGNGTIASYATLTFMSRANVIGTVQISGLANLTFTDSSFLGGLHYITGTTTLIFSNDASVGGIGTVIGSSNLRFTMSDTLLGQGDLQASSNITFTPAGTLKGNGHIVSALTITFSDDSFLAGSVAIRGTSNLRFFQDSTLIGIGNLTAGQSLTFNTAASMKGSGDLQGSGTLNFDGDAFLAGSLSMAGSAVLVFTSSALLSGFSHIVDENHFRTTIGYQDPIRTIVESVAPFTTTIENLGNTIRVRNPKGPSVTIKTINNSGITVVRIK